MGTFGITDFDSSNALCKDGTIDKNNPSNPCVNNGGVNLFGGANQPVGGKDFAPKKQNDEYARLQMEYALAKANEDALAQSQSNSQGNNTKEPIYYILVTALVLVAGYFAYKKFKK
jgi:hypothetical protein